MPSEKTPQKLDKVFFTIPEEVKSVDDITDAIMAQMEEKFSTKSADEEEPKTEE